MKEYIRKLERENQQMKDILARIGMALLEDMLNERECDCHDECDGCCCEGECDCDTCEYNCGGEYNYDDEDVHVIKCPNCGNPFGVLSYEFAIADVVTCPHCEAEINVDRENSRLDNVLNTVKEKLNKEELQATAEKLVEHGKDAIDTVLHSETVNDLKRRGRNIAIKLVEKIDEDLKKNQDDKK